MFKSHMWEEGKILSLEKWEDKKVNLPIGEEIKVLGVIEMEIVLYNDQSVTLGHVRYVTNLGSNIISLGRVEKLVYHTHMIDG